MSALFLFGLALIGTISVPSPRAAPLFAAADGAAARVEPIVANRNLEPAGSLQPGILTLALEAREGLWRPQSDEGAGVLVQAFGEVGGPLQIPGPLVRVRSGTTIDVTLRNRLGEPLIVYGLHTRPGSPDDTVHVASGAVRHVRFEAGAPGTYYYWGTTTAMPLEERDGDDSQLNGAFIVDPAQGPLSTDRIFVLGLWFQPADTSGPEPHDEREIMVINGKSWPNTERLTFTVGDSVRWRWINPTVSAHPMHLHGFYFRVDSRGNWARDSVLTPAQRPMVATELMMPGSTMDMRWSPEREGNWVMHCHFAFHISTLLFLAPQEHAHVADAGQAVTPHGMAGLVLGIHVLPRPDSEYPRSTEAARRLRLIAFQQPDSAQRPRYGYALHGDGQEPGVESLSSPGPTLVLRRGQPVSITVLNRTTEPTAVHWHGIELESFPDGVPGWSGTPARIMPAIAPRDSFVAEFVPPRAGTFIYHSHANELGQILGGLVGPLIVLGDADQLDAERDFVFLVSASATTFEESEVGYVNGQRRLPPLDLVAGRTYRLRFINIGDWRVLFTMLDDHGYARARPVAKDGFDLPPAQAVEGPLNVLTGPGETVDFEFTPAGPGVYRLEFKQQLAGWIIPVEVRVRAAR